MKILFCNITWLKYYKGIYTGIDEPYAGGDYVKITGDAHEKYNFDVVEFLVSPDDHLEPGKYCLGFVETGNTKETQRQIHIEKIEGCEGLGKEPRAEDVLVIFCAKSPAYGHTSIIGWYKNATVYRDYRDEKFGSDENPYYQSYNMIAKAEDCVLLPSNVRSRKVLWEAPRRSAKGFQFGFGRSNVWFARGEDQDERLDAYLKRVVEQIQEYDGENWLTKYPEGI